MFSIRTVSIALAAAALTATVAFAGGAGFKRVNTVAELDQAVAEASKAGKRVMVDFTATWCIPCKALEKDVFPDPAVQAALKDYVLLQVDVSKNSDADKALLKRFEAAGPPVLAFWDAKGKELKQCQKTGWNKAKENATTFLSHVATCTK